MLSLPEESREEETAKDAERQAKFKARFPEVNRLGEFMSRTWSMKAQGLSSPSKLMPTESKDLGE